MGLKNTTQLAGAYYQAYTIHYIIDTLTVSMTRFGSLLAGAVRDGFAKDVDDVNSVDYGGCKSEVPEADTTSITAIIDQQREEGDAKAAMTLAREYTMEFVDEEHAAAKREEEDLAYAERLDIELKDELVAEFLPASINTNLIWTKDSRRETSTNCS